VFRCGQRSAGRCANIGIDMTNVAQPLTIAVSPSQSISALLDVPAAPTACLVLAHGAGAGMAHPFLAALASGLQAQSIATLRYQFAYMENASKRPDPPRIVHAAVRAAVAEASRRLPEVPLLAGGKSFGGRMTSQAQALQPLPGVRGIVFVGFPLHPPRQPSIERARHLDEVGVPMLFLQGTRDELAELPLIESVTSRLGARATLRVFDDADHSFHVRKRSGRDDAQVVTELVRAIADFASRGPLL
jgi:predicted alpha/beta-hydrolase family hydrolase